MNPDAVLIAFILAGASGMFATLLTAFATDRSTATAKIAGLAVFALVLAVLLLAGLR